MSLTGNGASEPGPWTLWGQGHFTRFEGQAGETLDVDGDVTAAYLGVDYRWGPRGLAGVAVSHTRGTGGFRQPAWRGDLDATVTSVHPYAQVALTERLSVWGTLGYGRGELEVTDPNNAQNALTTDVAMRLAAVGVRGALPAMGGVAWTLKADGFLVQMDTEARVAFPETTADAQRLRLVLAGQRPWALAAGARLVPSLELGTRYDGGDAERGLGAEVGGGLRYTHPGWGLEVAARGRYLLVHQEAAFEQWSASLTAQVQPPDGSGKGVSVTLAPAWGPTASGVAGLWAGPTIGGVVPPGARTRPGGRLTAEVGYGLTAFDTGLLTPYAGTALTEGATRTFRVGTRLRVPRRGASALTLTLEGTRQEATGPRPVNQGLQLQVTGGF
ncbi:MAG: autotransporter outer membrane beta-barrel domain-containing protein [Nitrospira sp. SB0678_bin_10]|nr:autotransporter outer membrane beta-barrel domain-containing protein [Nitrospira sp. SB0678_bin_10]